MIEVPLRVMDTRVVAELTGGAADLLEREVRRAWSRCLDAAPEHEPDVRVPAELDDAAELDRVMDALSPAVTIAAIGHQAGDLLMLHAAGVAAPDGRTVALVGPSGTGKTTASLLLGERFGYVTDETVAVRADGTVAAYPKPLSIRRDGTPYKAQTAVDHLGDTPQSTTLHRVVVLRRDGAEDAWIERVPTLEALATVATETSYLRRMHRPLHHLADLLGARGGLRMLHYRDATQLVPLVDELMAEGA